MVHAIIENGKCRPINYIIEFPRNVFRIFATDFTGDDDLTNISCFATTPIYNRITFTLKRKSLFKDAIEMNNDDIALAFVIGR